MLPIFFLPTLGMLNALIAITDWGAIFLAAIVVVTYVTFPPQRVFHPNNMLFAYYGLYVVLSCGLNFILAMIGWDYKLPWGQIVFWDTFSKYTLYQIEMTFLVLFFSFHFLCQPRADRHHHSAGMPLYAGMPMRAGTQRSAPVAKIPLVNMEVSLFVTVVTNLLAVALVIWFLESTAGIRLWLEDYSATYLSKREGHGLLNVVMAAVGNAGIFLLGVRIYQSKTRLPLILSALVLIAIYSFPAGFKSRLIFLIVLLISPFLMNVRLNFRIVIRFALAFLVLLYGATQVRTAGFYASPPYFMEMLIGYFNTYQLHDWIVTSRPPEWFSTIHQILVKPMQVLGYAGLDENFDISVMLTKEFFPSQWDLERATQQWPVETELYLNYYGFVLGAVPLFIYAMVVSALYRVAMLQNRLPLIPIFLLEFQRLFSTLRGTLLPWELPIYIGQYILIFFICYAAAKLGAQAAPSRQGIPRRQTSFQPRY